MGDQADLPLVDPIDVPQHIHPPLVHGDDQVRPFADLHHRAVIVRLGLLQHSMERRDDRCLETPQQQAQVGAGVAPEQPEFVLHARDIHVAEIDVVGGADVIVPDVAPDLELDRIAVPDRRVRPDGHDQRLHLPPGGSAHAAEQVGGECGDPATVGWKRRNEYDPLSGLLFHAYCTQSHALRFGGRSIHKGGSFDLSLAKTGFYINGEAPAGRGMRMRRRKPVVITAFLGHMGLTAA